MPDAMPQLQPAELPGGFYDHENDADLALPRRRPVADWGADELFHGTPRRRRSQKALAARERRVSGPATVTRIEEARSYAAPVIDAPVQEEDARALVEHATAELLAAAQPEARRTVAITGRPEPRPASRAIERRRPPKTAAERIGHRPDHVAAWAVGLGFLLIVLAILSA